MVTVKWVVGAVHCHGEKWHVLTTFQVFPCDWYIRRRPWTIWILLGNYLDPFLQKFHTNDTMHVPKTDSKALPIDGNPCSLWAEKNLYGTTPCRVVCFLVWYISIMFHHDWWLIGEICPSQWRTALRADHRAFCVGISDQTWIVGASTLHTLCGNVGACGWFFKLYQYLRCDVTYRYLDVIKNGLFKSCDIR